MTGLYRADVDTGPVLIPFMSFQSLSGNWLDDISRLVALRRRKLENYQVNLPRGV